MSSLALTLGVVGLIILVVWLARNGLSFIDALTIVAFIAFLAWFVLTKQF